MGNETIPRLHAVSIIVLFLIGSTLFMGAAGGAKNNSWIAIIITICISAVFYVIYSRLSWLYPGMNLFDILSNVFGRILGKTVSCLYIWYAFHLGAIVLRNFGEFVKTTAMTGTPMLVPMLSIGLVCIWVAKAGLEVLGRSALLLMVFVILVVVLVQILSLSLANISYLKPVLGDGLKPVILSAFPIFSFPFAEIVLFMGIFHVLNRKITAFQSLLRGLLIGGSIILVIDLRNLMVLGPKILSGLYFPSYVAVSRINIGEFLTRIEGSVAIVFVMAIFVKISLCLIVACIGIKHLFGLSDYKVVVIPIGLLMIYFSVFIYEDIMEMSYFATVIYKYYAFPFQVVFPITLLLVAESKRFLKTKKKQKKKSKEQPQQEQPQQNQPQQEQPQQKQPQQEQPQQKQPQQERSAEF